MKTLLLNIWNWIKSIFKKPIPIFNPIKEGYQLLFTDTFSEGVNWNKWSHREPWSGDEDSKKGNTVWKKDCVEKRIEGLHLIARQGDNENHCGLISSHNFLEILYGYVSVTAKMPPKGLLYFPAIWMYNKQGWLPEVDIVELAGDESNRAWFTHHWLPRKGTPENEGINVKLPFDCSKKFHEFSLEWTPKALVWFVDGIEYYRTTYNIPTVPLFLICNIQAGYGPPFMHLFTEEEVPQSLIIKEIKIYQK